MDCAGATGGETRGMHTHMIYWNIRGEVVLSECFWSALQPRRVGRRRKPKHDEVCDEGDARVHVVPEILDMAVKPEL